MKKYIKLIIKNNMWHEISGLLLLLFIISYISLNFKELTSSVKNLLITFQFSACTYFVAELASRKLIKKKSHK